MPACHTMPFVKPGVVIAPNEEPTAVNAPSESCDYCGSMQLAWRKCKLICNDCRQINKSCADL